jgi:hypothetical protein
VGRDMLTDLWGWAWATTFFIAGDGGVVSALAYLMGESGVSIGKLVEGGGSIFGETGGEGKKARCYLQRPLSLHI